MTLKAAKAGGIHDYGSVSVGQESSPQNHLDEHPGIDCICPDCTYRFSKERYERAVRKAYKNHAKAVERFKNGLKFFKLRSNSLKTLSLLVLAILISPIATAQTPAPLPQNVYAAGLSYNGSGSPEVAGSALYAHLLDKNTGTYGFTVFDALPTHLKPFSVNTNVGVGVAQKAFSIGKVNFYVPADAGVSWQGNNMGWSWSTGVLASIKLYDNIHAYPNLRFQKSSVSAGSGVQPIIGVMFGYAK